MDQKQKPVPLATLDTMDLLRKLYRKAHFTASVILLILLLPIIAIMFICSYKFHEKWRDKQ